MTHRKPRGSALLSVTLLGLLLLVMGAGLVSVTTTFNKQSYGLNRQIVARYAAEAVLEEVKFRIKKEDYDDSAGWFDAGLNQADPVESKYVPEPLTTSPLKFASPDTALVDVSLLDATEASAQYGVTLEANEYLVEARATVDSHTVTLHMRVQYEVTSTSEDVTPLNQFSKFAMWSDTGGRLIAGEFTGWIHFNGSMSLSSTNDRFAMPITCTGTLSTAGGNWEDYFDYNRNGTLDTTPRAEYGGLSEADVMAMSGGAKARVDQPDYQDIDTELAGHASSQTAGFPDLAPLLVDESNPVYSGIGTLDRTTVSFNHDLNAASSSYKKTVATVTVYGDSGTVTNNVVIPPGQEVLLYSTPRVSSVAGTLHGQVTVASAFKGTPTDVYMWNSNQTVLDPPSVHVTDNIVLVDQDGHPKFWPTKNGSKIPQPSSRDYVGIPVDNGSNSNIDNMTDYWTAPTYQNEENPDYSPDNPSVLGLLGNGDVVAGVSTGRNGIINAAMYAADPEARVSAYKDLSDSYHKSIAILGSRVGSKLMKFSPYERIFRSYDLDFLMTPPPFWVPIAGTTTTTTETVESSYGVIYDAVKR